MFIANMLSQPTSPDCKPMRFKVLICSSSNKGASTFVVSQMKRLVIPIDVMTLKLPAFTVTQT
ncbi:hypothetical protein AT730_25700 (plasmid) [Vibrio alginolyticus]|nr:hypothetical protein AT730_25700 [Vibrio alginolyticus]